MLRTVAEAQAGLKDLAFRLRRELQRLTLEDPEPSRRREELGAARR